MAGPTPSDSEEDTRIRGPQRKSRPTTALPEHSEAPTLPSQQKRIDAAKAARWVNDTQAQAVDQVHVLPFESSGTIPRAGPSGPASSSPTPGTSKKRRFSETASTNSENDGDSEREDARNHAKPKAKQAWQATATDQEDVDEDGMFIDIDVQPIDDPDPTREDKTRDIGEFFSKPFERVGTNGKVKKHRKCKVCSGQCIIVNEATTLRRHCEAKFPGRYRKWAKANSFVSKLPGDVAAKKRKAVQTQQTMDAYMTERKLSERVTAYSDQLFREAAVEWLIATDQPIHAFEHPKFREMIDIASRATQGVRIPQPARSVGSSCTDHYEASENK